LKGDKPIFGICLGNQLLALAAGATTYKMKFGLSSPLPPLRSGALFQDFGSDCALQATVA
jgi:GMP synthase-like glutamine amidotransferase